MAKKKSQPAIQVDIVSDIVCPWCWLGKRYFDQAAKASGREIEVSFRPYMLDPNVPEGGVPYRDYMKSKFGPDGPSNRFKQMREHLEAAAPDAGINFRFSDIPTRPNTLRAHSLVRWAQGQDKGAAAKEALFEAFFDKLEDIGDIDVLSRIAGEIGMDATLTKELLEQGRDKNSVLEEIVFFQRLGISGVPTFIYNGQFAVQGAQGADVHKQAIDKAASMPAPRD